METPIHVLEARMTQAEKTQYYALRGLVIVLSDLLAATDESASNEERAQARANAAQVVETLKKGFGA